MEYTHIYITHFPRWKRITMRLNNLNESSDSMILSFDYSINKWFGTVDFVVMNEPMIIGLKEYDVASAVNTILDKIFIERT